MKRATAAALAIALLTWTAPLSAEPKAGECPVASPAAPLDLNAADEPSLLALPGIGPARARAILAYRAAHGGFRNISQLLHIKGIGRALLKELRPLVTIGAPPAPAR